MKNIDKIFSLDNTFIDVLAYRAKNQPDEKIYTFFNPNGNLTLTYSELEQKVKNLAKILVDKNLKDERALLLYPPGFDYIIGYFACLYAGVIAVPAYPPDPTSLKKTLPRLQSIVNDAKAKVALSVEEIVSDVDNWKNETSDDTESNYEDIFNLDWISTDHEKIKDVSDFEYDSSISSDTIAYLQYTSGSTGDPKGVIITHKNMIHNVKMIYEGFGIKDEEFAADYEGVIWLPIYHDMGLIGGILEPVFSGIHCTLVSPIDFLKRPTRWLDLISNIKGKKVLSGGPNFAYELCIKGTNPKKREEFDLSNWNVAFTGAEPVRAETINEFTEAFKSSGFQKNSFYPCYGLAEGTLIVSGGKHKTIPIEVFVNKEKLKKNKIAFVESIDENCQSLIGSGGMILDNEIKVVDPETKNICSSDKVGEVWVKSISNSQGYWNKEELSKEVFRAYTNDTNDGPFMRTGDLAFMHNGELFITGRLKDLIIIRGSNHYPQDIELTVENSNNLLRPSSNAAFSIEKNNDEHLIIVQEARAKNNVDWNQVCEDIKKHVLENHTIIPTEIVLIKPKTISKTSSGKIQRRATKIAFLENTLEIIFHWKNGKQINLKEANDIEIQKEFVSTNKIEEFITEQVAKELEISKNNVNLDLPFTNFGLDSAKSILLVGELEKLTGKELNPTILWNYPTIKKIAEYLSAESFEERSESQEMKDSEQGNDYASFVEDLTEEEAEELLLKKLNVDDDDT